MDVHNRAEPLLRGGGRRRQQRHRARPPGAGVDRRADLKRAERRRGSRRKPARRLVRLGRRRAGVPHRPDPARDRRRGMARAADGVAQRVRALELFVRDVYAERQIVAAGVVPAHCLEGARHYEPRLMGMGQDISSWITVAGLDVVRDSDGSFKVLEDNLRTPSGHRLCGGDPRGPGGAPAAPGGLRVRSLDAAFQTLGDAPARGGAARRPRRGSGGGAAERRQAQLGLLRARDHRRLPRSSAGSRSSSCRFAAGGCSRSSTAESGRSTSSTGAPTRTGSQTIAADRLRSRSCCSSRCLRARSRASTPSAPASPTTSCCTPTSRRWCASTWARSRCCESVPTYDPAQPGRARADPRAHRRARDQAPHGPRRATAW